jgi:hypothetical protein
LYELTHTIEELARSDSGLITGRSIETIDSRYYTDTGRYKLVKQLFKSITQKEHNSATSGGHRQSPADILSRSSILSTWSRDREANLSMSNQQNHP